VNILYIDSNEPADIRKQVQSEVADRDLQLSTETKGLKSGDFVIGDVCIERKEASDLASSIKDGRLKSQSRRIVSDFDTGYIIIEGDPYDLRYSNLHQNAVIGTQVSRSEQGMDIISVPDKSGTAYAVHKICEKHLEEDTRTEKLKKTSAETEDTFVAMLSCIRGISRRKAEKIAERYGSMTDLANNWSREKLTEIDGIGDKTAEKIISELNA